MSGTVRTRKSVFSLGRPGDDLDWYARAVAVLRSRPLTDPTSWRYMAAVHGYPGQANDPFAVPGEAMPSAAEQRTFWAQCQHQTWYFLPWHRGYLACFEEIVGAAVAALGGPPDWALPYWNYSDPTNSGARSLPPPFLDRSSALFVDGRNMRSAADQVPATDVNLSALQASPFSSPFTGGDPGFGGPVTDFSHFGQVNGDLENLPHNMIHDDVGGLMSDPDLAALDPIFWLHHSNIDRLWEVWTHRDSSFTDPTDQAWLTGETFQMHDKNGAVVSFTPSQMRDTTQVRHGYKYDDIADPLGGAGAGRAGLMATISGRPEKVAASAGTEIAMAGTATTARLTFQPTGAMLTGGPSRAFLNVENVTATKPAGHYEVHVNTPGGGEPLFAGRLSMFGVANATRRNSPHGGGGITTVLEITALLDRLRRERNWDGQHLDVTLVRRGPSGDTDLKIGQLSVYYH
jgi:tyrosinase